MSSPSSIWFNTQASCAGVNPLSFNAAAGRKFSTEYPACSNVRTSTKSRISDRDNKAQSLFDRISCGVSTSMPLMTSFSGED